VSGSTAWPEWFARHAPRLETPDRALAEAYAACWFGVFNDKEQDLALWLRDVRWMRSPAGVQERLDAWRGGGDPYTAAIEFAEHHPLRLAEARNAALELVLAGRGRTMRHALGLSDEPPPEPERPWLDAFFRDPPAGVRLEGVPFKDGEISVERSPRAAPRRSSGSRRSSPRR
jgi:hypothetical protein